MKKILITLLILLASCTVTYGVSQKELHKIDKELTSICNYYNNPCKVYFYKADKTVQAYTTTKGYIVFSSGIINVLDYKQLRSVGLHEVGHHVLKHYQKTDEFIDKHYNNLTPTLVKNFRHYNELEADMFAVSYLLFNNESEYLSSALNRITKPDMHNIETITHPSYNVRVQRIENLKKYLYQKQRYNKLRHVNNNKPYYLPRKE